MMSIVKVAAIVGAHGVALAFIPPIRLFAATVGVLCPIEDDDLSSYADED